MFAGHVRFRLYGQLAVHIGLVALNALPAIDPTVVGPIGGIETRVRLLATGLARLPGTEVTLFVRHERPLTAQPLPGVRVQVLVDRLYPVWQSVGMAFERKAGFPWVRSRRLHPRLLWQVPAVIVDRALHGRRYATTQPDARLRAVPVDCYATFGVQTHSLTVIRTAHAAGLPAVLLLGSDGDLDPLFAGERDGFDAYGTRAATGRAILREADLIIAQTQAQQTTLQERFGRTSRLLENPIDVRQWDQQLQSAEMPGELRNATDGYVLWVGRAENVHKRPGLCLEIARRCPTRPFVMLLSPRDPQVEAEVRAQTPPNVQIISHVPFEQMPAVFRRAGALLNTSSLEGFPNVFLQAALSRVPIVSLEVGTEFLQDSSAGVACGGDLDRVAAEVAGLPTTRSPVVAETAREYVIARHELGRQSERLREALSLAAAR